MSLSRLCRRVVPLFNSPHYLPLESQCIPNHKFSGSPVCQKHFGHGGIWRPRLGYFEKFGQHQPFAARPLIGVQRLYSSHASTAQEKSHKTLVYLTGLVFAMVAASYAAVPLYRRFCQATGYGGTITKREIVVQFNADVADGMQWKFTPTQREVRVKPGESALAFYTAENRSSTPIVGVSTLMLPL